MAITSRSASGRSSNSLRFTDPEVIPVLESFLVNGGDEFQLQAVRRLETFPQYAATKALVQYTVLPESVVVRDEAAKALEARPLYEHVPLLLGGLQRRHRVAV